MKDELTQTELSLIMLRARNEQEITKLRKENKQLKAILNGGYKWS